MMDPQASANIEMNNNNDASVCDDKTRDGDEELSSVRAPSNNADVMSKQHDQHHLTRALGKRACPDAHHHHEDGNLDHSSSQRLGSSSSKLLEESNKRTLRKPKVSVRARSETPMVPTCLIINY